MSTPPSDQDVMDERIAPSLTILGSRISHEFVRYFLASALALAVDTGTLWFMTSVIGVSYLVSGAFAFMLGLAVVYILSITWVFDVRRVRSVWQEFLIFAGIGIAGLLLNEAILALFTGVFGLFYLYSKVVSVIVVFTWNFLVRKYWLFR